MAAADLLVDLLMMDVSVALDGDQLRLSAPKGVIDAALRECIAAEKPALIEALRDCRAGAARASVAPLSFAQERMWLLAQIQGDSAAYNLAGALRLEGGLDVVALRRALGEIVHRHDTCRTTFAVQDGVPVQHVHPQRELELAFTDLQDLPDSGRMPRVLELARAQSAQPFDLESGPLLRVLLLQLAPQVHALIATSHHIVSDGWSMGVFVRELGALYAALLAGRPSPLPALPVQYAQFAAWQRRHLKGAALDGQLAYWRARLAPPLAPLSLPSDRPRPAQPSYAGAHATRALPPALSAALRALAQREQVTTFILLLAVFDVFLYRLSGQADIAVGTPVANRGRLVTESLLGFFANTLVIRADLSGRPAFTEVLRRVRQSVLEAYDHQDVPFEKLVAELQPPRDQSRNPFFDAMFVLRHADESVLRLPGIVTSVLDLGASAAAKFDLTLAVADEAEFFLLDCEYSTDLFDRAAVDLFLERFEALLESIVTTPAGGIDELPLLSANERERVDVFGRGAGLASLAAIGATNAAPGLPARSAQQFEAQAERSGEAVALSFDGASLSYGELNARANRVARHLRALGVVPGALVGLCVERSLDLLVALLGIQKSGGAYVPLDPDFPPDRLAYMLEDSGARVLVTTGEAAAALAVPATVQVVDLRAQRDALEALAATNLDPVGGPDDPAYVIYTSGSTGRPKGVVVSHAALSNFLGSMAREPGLEASDVLAAVTTISFDIAGLELYLPLVVGARIELLSREVAMDGEALSQALEASGATLLQATPATWRMLVESDWRPSRAVRALCGGEALPRDLADALLGRVSELWNLYGPTETTVWSTVSRVEAAPEPITVGHPIANTRIYVLGPDRQPMGIGVPGEIWIGGAGVALGYHNRPELTAERFVADPFDSRSGARMYGTGDLGRWDAQGRLHHLGRLDHQVKIRGYRIELEEIEAQLATHPAVRQAVVVAREAGPGDLRLVAYVVYHPGRDLMVSELRKHLRQQLPDYMIPAMVVAQQGLPLTPNGKIDRAALPEAFSGPRHSVQPAEPPAPGLERELAQIWRELLKVEHVSPHENFFELGGHSLLIVTLLDRMRRRGYVTNVRTVFAHPTLRSLAEAMAAATATAGARPVVTVPLNGIPAGCTRMEPTMLTLLSLDPAEIDQVVATVAGGAANVQDIYPLLPWQEGMLYDHLSLQPGQRDPYLARGILEFADRDRLEQFVTALQLVIDRHDALRTAIVWDGVEIPVQVVYRQAHLPQVTNEVLTFDLARAPLIATRILPPSTHRKWRLELMIHHIIVDQISDMIVMDEVARIMQGQQASLPSAPPMREFVGRALARTPIDAQRFFATMFEGVREPTHPFGLTDPRADTQRLRRAEAQLEPRLAARIRAATHGTGGGSVGPAALFHAAWALVVAEGCHRPDVVFGTVLAGRSQGTTGSDRAVGLFINTLPLRVRLDQQDATATLRQVGESLAALADHEQTPLAIARRDSQLPLTTPLFTSMVNFRRRLETAAERPPTIGGELLPGVSIVEAGNPISFPLVASIDDASGGFSLTIDCAERLDPQRVVRLLVTALERLLDALDVAGRDAVGGSSGPPLSALLPLSTDAIDDPSAEFVAGIASSIDRNNATQVELDGAHFPQQFEAQAERSGEAVALSFDGASLSYGELNARANRVARHLRALGVVPGALVGLCVERSLDLLVALLGIQKSGGAYVPLDPDFPPDRLAYMLEDSGARVLVTTGEAAAALAVPATVQVVDLRAQRDALEALAATNLDPVGGPDDPAYVIYTSGSTGRPKGVVVSHAALSNFLGSMAREPGLEASDVLAAVTTISFDIAGLELYLPLVVGARIELLSREVAMDGEALSQALEASGATLLQATPATWRMLVESDWRPSRAVRALCGGEALPRDLADALLGRVSELWNLYGPTETTVWSTVSRVEAAPEPITVGHPIANTRIYVLGPDRQPMGIGVPGEIWIGGAGVALGYHNRPELTAERFVADPFDSRSGARMYGTGDLGRWDAQGRLHHLGRLDHQVKIRGYRIELGEIEAQLATHPAVRQAVVVAREAGPGDLRLVAYVVFEPEQELTASDVRRHLRRELPDYMIPSAVVSIPSVPLTPNGKVDRAALPDPYRNSSPAGDAFEAPAAGREQQLAAIWTELLGIPRAGANDNFFEIGGHSLLALRVTVAARRRFGWRIDPRALFYQTLRQVAATATIEDDVLDRAAHT
jgi:amino acid adenylation domain-containing protein